MKWIVCLGLIAGCDLLNAESSEPVAWSTAQQGGFDDFGSRGAALGYAVDDTGRILVIGLRFSKPVYQQLFLPSMDGLASAQAWSGGGVVPPMVDDVQALPALEPLLTDTEGLRGMHGDITAVLSDPESGQLWISIGGAIQLTREDGPYDRVEGSLVMRPVTALGEAAQWEHGSRVSVRAIDLQWDTGEQW